MSVTTSVPSRSLHLVDLENLGGGPHTPTVHVLAAFDRFLKLAAWQPGDHVVVATNPALMARIAFDLPVPANVHCAGGHDGADLMLLRHSPVDQVARCYDRLVIGSGDGIFADRAAAVAAHGVAVSVVAPVGGCSWRLRAFAPLLVPAAPALVLAA